MFLGILLTLVFAARASANVEVWTDSNFHDNLIESKVAFVKFYAPWCGHCKQLAPIWKKLATEVSHLMKIVEIDCTEDGKDVCNDHSVQGYPTIQMVKWNEEQGHDDIFDYSGGRDLESLIAFVIKETTPPITMLKDEEVEGFVESVNKPVFLIVASNEDSHILASVNKTAATYAGLASIGVTYTASFAAKYGAKMNSIIFFKPKSLRFGSQEHKIVSYDESSVDAFIKLNILGKVALRYPAVDNLLKSPLVTVYLKKSAERDLSLYKLMRKRLSGLVEKFPTFTFAVADGKDYVREVYALATNLEESDVVVIFEALNKKRYLLANAELSIKDAQSVPAGVEKWLIDVENGSVEPYIMSEPIPSENEPDDHVVQVVGSTFQALVLDSSKDVFIEFYSPGCGHCKALAPIYSDLATKLKDEPNLVIAKMDATKNELPKEFPVNSYPTIMLVPKDAKAAPIEFNGDRTVDDMITWLESKVTEPLKLTRDEL